MSLEKQWAAGAHAHLGKEDWEAITQGILADCEDAFPEVVEAAFADEGAEAGAAVDAGDAAGAADTEVADVDAEADADAEAEAEEEAGAEGAT